MSATIEWNYFSIPHLFAELLVIWMPLRTISTSIDATGTKKAANLAAF
ncbi:hypothetical protein [Vibrio nomapromontoriensis]